MWPKGVCSPFKNCDYLITGLFGEGKFGEQAKFTYWQKLKLAAKLWLNHVTF